MGSNAPDQAGYGILGYKLGLDDAVIDTDGWVPYRSTAKGITIWADMTKRYNTAKAKTITIDGMDLNVGDCFE